MNPHKELDRSAGIPARTAGDNAGKDARAPGDNAGKDARAPESAVAEGLGDLEMHRGWHSRGYLPHFDHPGLVQFVTFRLYDAVPGDLIDRWKEELGWNEALKADDPAVIELRERIDRYEDEGRGSCYLGDGRIARLVRDTLCHFDGRRYRLVAWCIMPNHVHVVIETVVGHSLSDVVHSWKSFTSSVANRMLRRSGAFWMADYYDRFIRNASHLASVRHYIAENPVKAGLVDDASNWPWSGGSD